MSTSHTRMAARPLYDGAEVGRAIREILGDASGPRGAFVAFVGARAEEYLPAGSLDGFELVCWLKAGCTEPHALRTLATRGARLMHADALHMKVYWGPGGAVVTSSNLSDNGLGGGYHEVGVRLASGSLNVSTLRRRVAAREVTAADLLRHEKAHRSFRARNGGRGVFESRRPSGAQHTTFLDWLHSPIARTPWWWVGWTGDYSKVGASSRAWLAEQGQKSAYNFFTGRRIDFGEEEWLLTIDLRRGRGAECDWMHVDKVSPAKKGDDGWEKGVEVEAIQRYETSRYGRPPFTITAAFQNAVREVLRERRITDGKSFARASPKGKPDATLLRALRGRLS